LQIRLKIQLHPTEPANYRGSYTTVSKEIVDIEIAMYQSAGTIVIMTGTATIALGTIVITTMELLFSRRIRKVAIVVMLVV
jgi:hypothetical protein